LSFIDENGGLGRLSGKPTRAGSYDFEVVATDASGQSARMAVKIVVAPEPSQDELVDAFLRAYNYGPCFLVRRSAPADGAKTLDAIGDDAGAFQRFQTAYKQVVGAVSPANFKAILPPQCPALQLLKLSASGIAPEPRVELTHFEVGGALPLTGTVSGVAGRRLALLIIGEDGAVYHIATKPTPGGDVAAFSEELGRVDDSSVGPLQLLLAVVSDKPLAALEGFKTGAIGDLAPKLIAEWERAGASAKAGFFKLRK